MPLTAIRAALLCTALATAAALPPAPAQANGLAGAYLAARSAEQTGDYRRAAEYYVRALADDPENLTILRGAVIAFLSLGEVDKAVSIARRMEDAGLNGQVASIALAAGDVEDGDWDGLLAQIAAEAGIGPLVDGLLNAWAQIGKGAMTEALAAFDAVAEGQGLRSFGLYHKALALASVGDFEGADAILGGDDAGILRTSRRGVIAHMQVLSQLDRNDDALILMQDSFGTGLDSELEDLQTRLEAGETLPFTVVQTPRDGVAEVFYGVAGALRGEANDAYTLLYSRAAEYLDPDHIDAILQSASLLEDMGRFELAVAAYKKVPAEHPAFAAAELGRADALRQDGKLEAATEVLEQLAKLRPGMPDVHVTLGDVMRAREDFTAAIEAYDRAIALVPEPGPRQWFVFYARGIAHERAGNWPEAEADFRAALELNPGQPQVLNYLGYSLVEKQEKLAEALEMIEQAVAARPDSGYIVDSLGWVLYRLGRYDEAVGHMERAAELMATDPIVNDHLGDVYWAVGRRTEARFQWNRALSFEPEADDAQRIRRKLEVGLDTVLEEEGAPPLGAVSSE